MRKARLWRNYYTNLVPVYGWSETMTKLGLKEAFPKDRSMLLRFASPKDNTEYHWRYLDASGVTLEEYLHAVAALGFDGVYHLLFAHKYDYRETQKYVDSFLGRVRASDIPKDTALTTLLQLMARATYPEGVMSDEDIDVIAESERQWEVMDLVGQESFAIWSKMGATLEEMKLMHENDIDLDLLIRMR